MNPSLVRQFDLVLIVNLTRRADRRAEVIEQLRAIGEMPGERIRFFPAAEPSEPLGFRTIGARGCFLSHLGCLQMALDEGATSLLIFEDDIDFPRDYARLQTRVAEGLRTGDWEMFYGGGLPEYGTTPLPPVHGGTRLVPFHVPIRLSHFVAIRGPRILELRDYLVAMLGRPEGDPNGGPMDVDGAYGWFRREREVITWMAEPALGDQRASASDVTPSRIDRVPLLAPMLGFLRRAKRALRR
ncbi:MAG: LPS biosynthesis glycosyltransferase [Planctomycetaceae bacterium]|nr:LPS biosynthesis glycosyltransferase [Planctomycetaceae bacterium]